ncbi:MAG: hypothetical protein KDL31_08725 [Kiritimatiellae bacterium]|nr:hypothetical protein [Kiritimatiellia bacterium]
MKTKWLAGCLWLLLAVAAPAADQIHALMIEASNEPAVIDRRLEKVEYKLRRVFGFPYYHFVAEQTVMAPSDGQVTVPLANGHRLILSGKGLRVTVQWFKNDEILLTTKVSLNKGSPVVLGGVPHGDGTLIVALTAQ